MQWAHALLIKFAKIIFKVDIMLSLFERFVIIVVIVVSIVDIAGFYAIQKDPKILTIQFVILIIIATIIPIAINLWYWLVFKQ